MEGLPPEVLQQIPVLEQGLDDLKKSADAFAAQAAMDKFHVVSRADVDRLIGLVTKAKANFTEYKKLVDALLAKLPVQ